MVLVCTYNASVLCDKPIATQAMPLSIVKLHPKPSGAQYQLSLWRLVHVGKASILIHANTSPRCPLMEWRVHGAPKCNKVRARPKPKPKTATKNKNPSALLPHLDRIDHERAIFDVLRPRRVPLVLRLRKVRHRSCNKIASSAVPHQEGGTWDLLSDPSSHGLFPTPSGNHPFVPPTATFMIK